MKSQEDLARQIEEAKKVVEIGAKYRHYKSADMIYEVRDIAVQESDEELCVIYKALYGDHVTFSRALKSWLEEVEKDGSLVPRFTKI